MNTKLGIWVEENAMLFRYIAELKSLKPDADSILMSGNTSAILSSTMRALYDKAKIYVAADSAYKEDAKSEIDSFEDLGSLWQEHLKPAFYDIVVSTLAIEHLNVRELTPYLFNLYDSLKHGGILYLSFPESVRVTGLDKELSPSWYDMEEQVYMKYYSAQDVVNALSMIGFEIKAIEKDEDDALYSVVTTIGAKK